MRQGDGTDLLGQNDPRSASIGVIYVAPNDDRQSVLTAILTQDKLGRKQVAVVLPEDNKAFQRPVDFDGLKNMRRGLKTQIAFVAPIGPGPAEFARQRRFPVYSSLESFSQSLKAEALVNGTAIGGGKRGLFRHKPKPAEINAMPSTSSGRNNQVPNLTLPNNIPVESLQQAPVPPRAGPGEDDVTDPSNESAGPDAAAIGLVADSDLGALADDHNDSSTLESSDSDWHVQSQAVTGSMADEDTLPSNAPVQDSEEPKLAGSSGMQSKADPDPGIIAFPAPVPSPQTSQKFPVLQSEDAATPIIAPVQPTRSNASSATPPTKRGNTGKNAAVGAGAAGLGTGAAVASRTASGGGGLPPGGSSPGGPGGGGGGVGGSRRRTRLIVAILLIVLTLLLIGGVAAAAVPGGLGSLGRFVPGAATTATVTITPASKDLKDTYVIMAVTGKPDPAKREVAARIPKATSPAQSRTVNSTGSIPGTRATGSLTFLNTSNSSKSFDSVILRGASEVPVSFNGPVTVPAVPPASVTVTGFAVNVGASGNIGALDISGICCAAGITVKNGAFGGGQDAEPNSVVQQSDINGAANALVGSLTPATQSALQKQVKANEQPVANTFQCNKSTFNANHKAGDHAKTVTVTVAVTCKEEVYDEQGALMLAADLLKMAASKDPGPAYALTGNIVTGVTKATVVDTNGTVSLLVRAEGVWVYVFTDAAKKDLANHIANMKKQDAIKYLTGQPGVSSVQIEISSGDTLPDAAHITINIKPVPGATGAPTVTPPTVVPTGAATPPATPPITPTPTQGLGGAR